MYVTPSIQNLIRENKSFRIDSEIQTGKKYGMQLLDDNLWYHFQGGRISAEESIDKSKNPGGMVDRMQRNGIIVNKEDDALMAEAEDQAAAAGAAPAKAGGGGEADRNAQIAANRARMAAMQQKK
jgi:Tfp pilus assembly ATPase PilU